MAISELIKYEGDNSTFIWKYPGEDFNSMTELVVHENQEAVFFANGQAADTFGPGRYKLDAENIPLLSKTVNVVTGVSVFHCEVYFINKTVQMAVKWGTDSKVRMIEPTLGVPIELGASGEMNIAISDGRKMLIKLIGTMKGIAWGEEGAGFTKSLNNSFRPLISTAVKTNLPRVITDRGIDIVEIDQHLTELSVELKKHIISGFEEYGLTIAEFYVSNVLLPEADPNFKRLRELHTVSFQKRMAEAEAEIRTKQAESRAIYETAEQKAAAQIKIAEREAILQEQTTETEIAKREAERRVIDAQAKAQAMQMEGIAEATVMQAQGYNQKDLLQAEVQKAYAEGIGNMGPESVSGGGSSNSIMGDMMSFGVGMAAINAMAPQMGEMMKGFGSNPMQQLAALKCASCGADIPAGSKFCLQCGTKVKEATNNEISCPRCGQQTPVGRFCINCGQALANKCTNCGAEILAGSKFCQECGSKL